MAVIATKRPRGKPMPDSTIVHDAEYYISQAPNKEAWAEENAALTERLEELESRFGRAPNIIHIMWDDMAFGDLGIPALQAIRGFEAPNIDRIVQEGAIFTGFRTEPSCTPSRAAVITGRHPIRNGMSKVGWPLEFGGMSGEEVTTANVLSEAGYATAFYSKWHLGDIEESYPYNQGFDEALFDPYNQVSEVWNAQGDAANAALNVTPDSRKPWPYVYDQHALTPDGWVMAIEGNKGEEGKEWRPPSPEAYQEIDIECERRMMDFIDRQVSDEKPFFVSYWPLLMNMFPIPEKKTMQWGFMAEGLKRLDGFIGELMDRLNELGIAENTVLVCHADNGPMSHDPPTGMGLAETIFRGGKGNYTEGGVRVPAFAWWPGTIEPGAIVNDIIHEVDLFTTFARIGKAIEHVPTDRVIDGIDQTSLLMAGDGHGRRDYAHVYLGEALAATVKGRFKRHWGVGGGPDSGVSSAFFDLVLDPREASPLLVPMVHTYSQFDRIRARHELWNEKYPHRDKARGIPFTGLSNARPETLAIGEKLEALQDDLPFDAFEFMDWEPPWEQQQMNAVD
ncbi:MAG: sulfatase-like hydrolase/transferase [Acidimicrobiia bacterium]